MARTFRVISASFIVGISLAGCGAPAPSALSPGPWARVFPSARAATAPVATGGDVVLAVTTLDTGAVTDERGTVTAVLLGDARRAVCSVVRVSADGAIAWQVPIVARTGQTLCTHVTAEADELVAVGEAFDVDDDDTILESGGALARVRDGFAVHIAGDGVVTAIDATAAPEFLPPELAGRTLDVDDGRALTAPSAAGYLQKSGAVATADGSIAALLVPQGTALDPLVSGALPAPTVGGADESVVVVARLH